MKAGVDLVYAEEFQTALKSALDDIRAVIVVLWIATGLGLEDRPVRQSAEFLKHQPDSSFALAVAIECGRVDVIEWAVQERANGLKRLFLGNWIAERLGHVAQFGTANRYRRDHQSSRTKCNTIKRRHEYLHVGVNPFRRSYSHRPRREGVIRG